MSSKYEAIVEEAMEKQEPECEDELFNGMPVFEDADGDKAHVFLEEVPGEGLVEVHGLHRCSESRASPAAATDQPSNAERKDTGRSCRWRQAMERRQKLQPTNDTKTCATSAKDTPQSVQNHCTPQLRSAPQFVNEHMPLIREVAADGEDEHVCENAFGRFPVFQDADGDVAHCFLEEIPGLDGLFEVEGLLQHDTVPHRELSGSLQETPQKQFEELSSQQEAWRARLHKRAEENQIAKLRKKEEIRAREAWEAASKERQEEARRQREAVQRRHEEQKKRH